MLEELAENCGKSLRKPEVKTVVLFSASLRFCTWWSGAPTAQLTRFTG